MQPNEINLDRPTPKPEFLPPEPEKPKKFSWKTILIYAAVAIVSAGISGGGVWYFMNQANNDLQAKINTKNKSITTLEGKITSLEDQVADTAPTSSQDDSVAASGKDMFNSLVSFCGTDNKTVQYTTLTNETDGQNYFGHCAVNENGAMTGGYVLTARYTNNTWQEIYKGQGPAASSVCTQYQIPSVLGTCTQ